MIMFAGDDRQLSAVEPGGMRRLMVHESANVHRTSIGPASTAVAGSG